MEILRARILSRHDGYVMLDAESKYANKWKSRKIARVHFLKMILSITGDLIILETKKQQKITATVHTHETRTSHCWGQ